MPRNVGFALLILWLLVGAIGLAIDLQFPTVAVGLLLLSRYGFLRLMLAFRPYYWMLTLPLLILILFLPVAWLLSGFSLDDRYHELTPVWEKRLTSTLVCRAYPHNFDSLPGSRLIIARETTNWPVDEVVDEISEVAGSATFKCVLEPDDTVRLTILDDQGVVATKRVKV